MRDILLLVPDLMLNARIGDVVRAMGGTPKDLRTHNVLEEIRTADLLIVDTGQRTPWLDLVRKVKTAEQGASLPVLAFGPHVDVETQRTAIAAGCDRVVTRGKFMAELPQLIASTARQHDERATQEVQKTLPDDDVM